MYLVTYKIDVTQMGDDTAGTLEYRERTIFTWEEAVAVRAMLAKDPAVSDIKLLMEI